MELVKEVDATISTIKDNVRATQVRELRFRL